jgi:hypothetical protein
VNEVGTKAATSIIGEEEMGEAMQRKSFVQSLSNSKDGTEGKHNAVHNAVSGGGKDSKESAVETVLQFKTFNMRV